MKLIKGDLLDTELEFIVHGCNGRGVMGSGVAKALRDKWPEVYNIYRKCYIQYGLVLGTATAVPVEKGRKIVFNAITQSSYGRDGRKYVYYTAILKSLEYIISNYTHQHTIAISKIGCSLGGGKWEVVSEILMELEELYNMEFWVYEL